MDCPIARITGRAFVTWNTIHWPGRAPTSPEDPGIRVLIHELAHCWQHQTRRRQLSRGIVEQTGYTLFGWWMLRLGLSPLYDPYDFGGPDGVRAAHSLDSFRLEAQASIIESRWSTRHESSPFARDLARLCHGAGIGSVAGADEPREDSGRPSEDSTDDP